MHINILIYASMCNYSLRQVTSSPHSILRQQNGGCDSFVSQLCYKRPCDIQ